MFGSIHYLGIVVATVASLALGYLWYSPFVFGQSPMTFRVRIFWINLVATLITAFVLERVLYNLPLVTLRFTLSMSVLLWLGFTGAISGAEYFSVDPRKSWSSFAIDQGRVLVSIIVMTLIIFFMTA